MYSYYENEHYPVPSKILVVLSKAWNAPELLEGITDIEALPTEGMLPDLGELSAGSFQLGRMMEPYTYAPAPAKYLAKDNAVATVGSDSMYPTLLPRDRVIVRLTNSPPTGSIVVAVSDEAEMIVKRLVYRNGERILIGDNPDHPTTDPKRCQLIGEVLAIYERALK